MNFRLIGRTNLDYGRYIIHSDEPTYGVQVNDTRLGFIASFDKKWTAKTEICFDNRAISFRDLWIGYAINKEMSVTAGNHFQPFGAKTLGLNYKFIEDAQADYAICPSRKIGVSYDYTTNLFKGTAGLYSDANIDNLGGASDENQGYSVSAKAIVRPICGDSTVLHFGVAGMYTDVANDYAFSVRQPETFNEKTLLTVTAPNLLASNINRGEAEVIFIHRRFYAEAHYLTAFVNVPENYDNIKMNGGYAQASFLLIGEQQNYNKKTALATNASPKNLEILFRADYLSIDEHGILGEVDGAPATKVADFTVGLNYFFNKHLNARLNYTVSNVCVENNYGGDDFENTNNAIQARLQFAF